jgi:membrane fusion protein (multidrug efflux system)
MKCDCTKSNISIVLLFLALAAIAGGLAAWKHAATQEANAASANMPEPMESVTMAVAKPLDYREETTSIGTIIALRSITLSNELAGTVREVRLAPGQIVEAGAVLVSQDVAVELAELKAQAAQAKLAQTTLDRIEKARVAISALELDRAAAERDVALARSAAIQARIEKKTIRAPFRARVGLADVHPGQYLDAGTKLTTLQGVDEAVHVDFSVAQPVARSLAVEQEVQVFSSGAAGPTPARIVALDARIDPTTRNALVRARIDDGARVPEPGASVRVQVPVGTARKAVSVPVSALRKGPEGDHVFVIGPDPEGKSRAHLRKVESGALIGDEVAIYAGISAGETIAASGSFKLRENALVAVSNTAAQEQRKVHDDEPHRISANRL